MDAEILKTEAMAWLRYGLRMPIVCSEVGRWNADVLGVGPTRSVEVEVKLSRQDLQAEFRNKSAKHFFYANAAGRTSLVYVPNQFYFMVPEAMVDMTREVISSQQPKAGLIAYLPDGNLLDGRNCSVIVKAEKLHDNKPAARLIKVATMRMSSELCGTRMIAHRGFKNLRDRFWNEMDKIIALAVRSSGTLDLEDADVDRDRRAAELAKCVDGLDWEPMNEEQRGRWRDAAKKFLTAQYLDLEPWKMEEYLR